MAVDLEKLAANFDLRGPVTQIRPCGNGHINDSYRVDVSLGGFPISYLMQRINHHVFPNVRMLMNNISRVTRHIQSKMYEQPGVDFSRTSLTIIPTTEGAPYYKGPEGYYWRMFLFINNSVSYDYVSKTSQAYEAAKAFGNFQALLSDMPGAPLFESIPDFHHTPRRFQTFHSSLKADRLNRAASVKKEIDFILAYEDKVHDVTDGLADGSLPLRVTHNDTKINNVMMDAATGEALCVVDLDTVMPGSALYDFGDLVRTSTVSAPEDEQDLSKIQFRLDMFEALVQGYLESPREMLVRRELELLVSSGSLITFEVGLRFLTDYLDGDKYFKIKRRHHNLDRCRTQLELVRQMDQQKEKMQEIIDRY